MTVPEPRKVVLERFEGIIASNMPHNGDSTLENCDGEVEGGRIATTLPLFARGEGVKGPRGSGKGRPRQLRSDLRSSFRLQCRRSNGGLFDRPNSRSDGLLLNLPTNQPTSTQINP